MCYNEKIGRRSLRFGRRQTRLRVCLFCWVAILTFSACPLGKGRWKEDEGCLSGCVILHFGIFAVLLRSGFWYIAWSIRVFGIDAADGGFTKWYAGENDFDCDVDFSLSSAFRVGHNCCDCVLHGYVFCDTDFVCVSFDQWSCRLPQKDLLVRSSSCYSAYV